MSASASAPGAASSSSSTSDASSTSSTAPDATGAVAEAIVLTVDGIEHRGWLELTLAHSIEAAALKFDLGLTERWTAKAPPRDRLARPGARCTLALGQDVVLDGWVDTLEVRYDDERHRLHILGRDRVADLVDAAARIEPPYEWSNIGLEEFTRRLCEPFGLEVRAETEMGAPFARASIQPGETAWDAIERACRQRGVLATSDGRGTLRLTKAGAGGKGAGALQMGGAKANITSADGIFDWTKRHDQVVVRGNAEGRLSQGQARARDAEVTRHRPRLLIAEAAAAPGAPNFQTRADWEVRTAAARSRRVTYTVPGWRGPQGALWRPNTLVWVRDKFLDLDREMLVAAVIFRLDDDQGSRTEIEVAPREAFERLPEPEQRGTGAVVGLYVAEPGARNEGAGAGFRRRTDAPPLPAAPPGTGGRR